MAFDASKVINGTFGSVQLDGDDIANIVALEATVSIDKEDVKQCGTLAKGYKVTGIEGKGTIKCNKVDTRFGNLISQNLSEGKDTTCTIVSTLEDPDSDGTESVQLNNCKFDKLTVADWEARKLGEESYDFTFESWQYLSTIDPE